MIRDRQERLLEEQRKRIEELRQLPGREAPAEHAQPAQDERCFEIKSIKLQGVSLLSESTQQELLKPFLNRCLGANQLNELLKAITQHYMGSSQKTENKAR